MKYYLKFAWNCMGLGTILIVSFLFSTKLYYGVYTNEDIAMGFVFMILFSLVCILFYMKEIINLYYHNHHKQKISETEKENISKTYICPYCYGDGEIVWGEKENPIKCWNCDGKGVVKSILF